VRRKHVIQANFRGGCKGLEYPDRTTRGHPMSDPIYYPDFLVALDMLHGACVYLRNRYEAQANMNARAILFNCTNLIFREQGCGISREEVEGAVIIEREATR
jgi:hypothetical protein